MSSNADEMTNNSVCTVQLFSTQWTISNIFINTTLAYNMSRATSNYRKFPRHPHADGTFDDLGDFQVEVTHCLNQQF